MSGFTRRNLLAGVAGALGGRPVGSAGGPSPAGSYLRRDSSDGRLNLIMIVVDTWSTVWMGCYGNPLVRTPSVDRLASRSAVFVDAYPEALPTIPARRVMYTGRRAFPGDLWRTWNAPTVRGWHPLYEEDYTLAEKLIDLDWGTLLVSDLYHGFQPGFNLHRGFEAWHDVRGQEADGHETGPNRGIDLTAWLHPSQVDYQSGYSARQFTRYLVNRSYWKTEDDWPVSQVFTQAGQWLENRVTDDRPFYLHIESYSPHEYWDPPDDYYRLYMRSNYTGPRLIQPPDDASVLSPAALEHVRALYAGMVTFTDTRLGRFLQKVEDLGLMENTIIVFVADHGTQTGEQGEIHKKEWALRRPVTNVPFLIYFPLEDLGGRRVNGFVQHTDIYPTLMDLMGAPSPPRVTGQSLKDALWSGEAPKRDFIVTGWGDHASIRTAEYNYIGRWNPGDSWEQLYDLRKDPAENTNILVSNLNLVGDCRTKLRQYVEQSWEITRGNLARKLTE